MTAAAASVSPESDAEPTALPHRPQNTCLPSASTERIIQPSSNKTRFNKVTGARKPAGLVTFDKSPQFLLVDDPGRSREVEPKSTSETCGSLR